MKAQAGAPIDRSDLPTDLASVACVAAIIAGLHGGTPFFGTGLIIGILGLLLTSGRIWRGKFSTRLALVIFLLVTLGSLLGMAQMDWMQGFQRYRIVIELMIGIALLQRVVVRLGLRGLIGELIAGVPRWRSGTIGILSMILTIPLSLATVPLVTTVMAPVVTPSITAAQISMRAVPVTMLLLPTTLASAAVSASLPGLSGSMVALAGLPLFLVGFTTICLPRIELSAAAEAEETPWERLAVYGAGFWIVFGIALAFGRPVPESVAIAGACLFVADALSSPRPWQASVGEFRDAVSGTTAEVLLLLSCGALAAFLSAAGELPTLNSIVHALWRRPLRCDWLGYRPAPDDLHVRNSSDHSIQPHLSVG